MPPRQPQYPIKPEIKRELDATINELEELGIIAKIENPPTNLPVMGVPKPDKTNRRPNFD